VWFSRFPEEVSRREEAKQSQRNASSRANKKETSRYAKKGIRGLEMHMRPGHATLALSKHAKTTQQTETGT
jgi:hypothetical protein